MQEYPDDLVITVDDDMLYEPQLVARLLASYARYPNAVSARRVHRMAKKTDGTIAAYNDWEYECKTIVKPQMDLFPTTGSGVLFPAHCMDACVLDQELFMRECDAADDVWLKFMQLKKGTPTVYVPGPRFLELPGTQTTSLSAENVDACRNDVFIQICKRSWVCSLAISARLSLIRTVVIADSTDKKQMAQACHLPYVFSL